MKGILLYLHALTPVHSGTGQSVAVIDLPIAREKATGWPVIPGSSIKGVVRDLHRTEKDREVDEQGTPKGDSDGIRKIFGEQDNSGDIALGDQRILFLAVRSYFGTFAYLTCPTVLQRHNRDIKALGGAALEQTNVTGEQVLLGQGSTLAHGQGATRRVYLEDIDLTPQEGSFGAADRLSEALFDDADERTAFVQRAAVVSDDVFSYFCETGTEVAARVVLKAGSKTVDNLWYEEAVPAESIFFGPAIELRKGDSLDQVRAKLDATRIIQIGGDASVGRGLCRVVTREVP